LAAIDRRTAAAWALPDWRRESLADLGATPSARRRRVEVALRKVVHRRCRRTTGPFRTTLSSGE